MRTRHSARTLASAIASTLVLASATACGSNDASPTAPEASQARSAPAAAAMQAGPEANGKRDDIIAYAARYDASWLNAAAFAGLFAPDVRFIGPIGIVQPSRNAVQAAHAMLFAGPFNGSTRVSTVNNITFLTGTIAVLDMTVALTGYRGLPPGLQPTVGSTLYTRERAVLEKRQGAWTVVFNQISPVTPGSL